ncbi:MAG: dTMP kinase [bacterium]
MSPLLQPGDPDRKGALIVFEGIDGSGKSTQANLLADHLRDLELEVVLSMEPTDGPHGRALRELWVSGGRHDVREELELFRLDRNQHVHEKIEPALRAGKVVILDRYYYSSEAYQGVRGGPTPDEIHTMMTAIAPRPDCTLILELEPKQGFDRITRSRADTPNALEQLENLLAVCKVFDEMSYPEIHHVDASADAETLFQSVLAAVVPVLRKLELVPVR